jgi:aldose sugar dehydrogenase
MMMNNKISRLIVLLLFALFYTIIAFVVGQNNKPASNLSNNQEKQPITDLEIPWDITFFEQTIYITERPGRLIVINDNQRKNFDIDTVYHNGEGGLLGIALHPNFKENSWIYLYQTQNDNGITNAVYRYQYNNELSDKKPIITNIPGATFHNGGRIVFGPDKKLYITTGDAQDPNLSQDTNSLAGKILRINDDGTIPNDNPFGNAVYSYGHRNPQGLAFDSNGNLWSTEHGQRGNDEINLIKSGLNYGWPIIEGDDNRENMVSPVAHSGNQTWAPSGMIILENKLMFGGLRGQALFIYKINNDKLEFENELFSNDHGRMRKVSYYEDMIYILTSNKDGRGKPQDGDDKVLIFNKNILEK